MAASSGETSLGLLSQYYASSSEDESEDENKVYDVTKRKHSSDECSAKRPKTSEQNKIEIIDDVLSTYQSTTVKGIPTTVPTETEEKESTKSKSSDSPLPLPTIVLNMYSDKSCPNEDNPDKHQGRIRNFPHEVGNWATIVYVPFDPGPLMKTLLDAFCEACSPDLQMIPVEDFHISVSKTVVIHHHWIKPLLQSLQQHLTIFPRSFLGLKIHTGADHLRKIVGAVDECFSEFRLKPFHKDPSFHMSICWCNGDKSNILNSIIGKLQVIFGEVVQQSMRKWIFHVTKLAFKTGHKIFTIPLQQDSVLQHKKILHM